MAFHEVRFPDNISRGARGGPERRTQIVELASGDEERNASWANSRRRYDVAYGIRRADDLAAVVAFFEARNGRLHGFRFKDWGDHKSCLPSATPAPTDQAIGTGDDATTTFQLVKRYASGSQSWVRTITKPVAGSVTIALNGAPQASGWSVDTTTGVITFTTAPGSGVAVTAGFEFDVPVRRTEVLGHDVTDGIAVLTLLEAPVRSIAEGDAFTIRAGCDKRIETCGAKFANTASFRGFPHIPGQDAVLRYATKDGGHEGGVL